MTSSNDNDSEHNTEEERKPMQSASKAKRKRYAQKYTSSWERQFKWIMKSSKGATYFYCKTCRLDCVGGITEIKRHESTTKHVTKARGMETQRDITTVLQESVSIEQSVKESEIRLTSFILEHNIPFNVASHLPNLLKAVCPDSKIAKQITLGRYKCTGIVKNVIGKNQLEKTIAIMKIKQFSIIVDESTDKSTSKHLCLVTKYIDDANVVRDVFFCFVAY